MNKHTEYNKYGLFLLLLVTLFSVVWIVWLSFSKNSIDLGEFEETKPAESQKKEAASGTKEDQAPAWIASESLIQQGLKLYQIHCAVCHGPKGLGDGTPGLVPPPRNLVEGKWKQGGSARELFITLQKGVEGSSMVSFKHLSKEDRWALVHYIQSITKHKVVDDAKTLEEFAKTAL